MEWLDIIQGLIYYILCDLDRRSRLPEVKGQNRFCE